MTWFAPGAGEQLGEKSHAGRWVLAGAGMRCCGGEGRQLWLEKKIMQTWCAWLDVGQYGEHGDRVGEAGLAWEETCM